MSPPRCVVGRCLVARRPFRHLGFFLPWMTMLGRRAHNHIRCYPNRYGLTHPRSFSPWVVDVQGSRSLGVIPSTSSHVMQLFTSTQRPAIPCSASFCWESHEKTLRPYQRVSGFLANYTFNPPSDIDYNTTPTYMPISLPTRPLSKPRRHPKVSSLNVPLAVCPPAFL